MKHLSCSITILVLVLLQVAAHGARLKQPNILWIITDDQRSDSLACYNRATRGTDESELGYVESPSIDRLAAEGVLFTDAYCNSLACAPSRSSMHTGKYVHRCGMYGFRKAHQAADCSSRVIPEVMKENGYQPSMFGKSGYYIFDWEGYHQWTPLGYYQPYLHRNRIEEFGESDFWFNRPWGTFEGKGMVLGAEEVWRDAQGNEKRYWLERKDRELTAEEIATRKAVEKEMDIVRSYPRRQNKNLILGGVSLSTPEKTMDGAILKCMRTYFANEGQDYKLINGDPATGPDPSKPVFINLGFVFPHTPVIPTKEFRDRFAGKQYKAPEYDPREAVLLTGALRDLRDDMDFSGFTDSEKQQLIRDYYAFCAQGDYLVGEAVKSFKEYCAKHKQEYLIVFVCGDHGWHLGEQGIEAKFGPWFQTTHDSVIMVSSDKKKVPAGKVVKDWVEFVDFAPTFYDVADIDAATHPGLDGFSLFTTMNEGPQREYVIGEMNQTRGDRAYLRSKDFAFAMNVRPFWTKPGEGYEPGARIRWALEAKPDEVAMSLYDLRCDPYERVNVAYHADYAKLAAFLRSKLCSIVLGDRRVECDWTQENKYHISNFAPGAHDRMLDIPTEIIPKPGRSLESMSGL